MEDVVDAHSGWQLKAVCHAAHFGKDLERAQELGKKLARSCVLSVKLRVLNNTSSPTLKSSSLLSLSSIGLLTPLGNMEEAKCTSTMLFKCLNKGLGGGDLPRSPPRSTSEAGTTGCRPEFKKNGVYFVDSLGELFTANSAMGRWSSQSTMRGSMYIRSICSKVRFARSVRPSARGWKAEESRSRVPKASQMQSEKRLGKLGIPSDTISRGKPCWLITRSRKIRAAPSPSRQWL